MTERVGPERPVVRGDDEFERRLFAMIEVGELDFPKGAVRPGDEAAPRGGLLQSLGAGLRHLLPRFPRLFLTAAVAYGLALVVSLPAYLLLFPQSWSTAPSEAPPAALAPAVSAPPLGRARVLELGAGPTRAAGVGARLTIAPGDTYVVLSFLVPIRSGPGIVHHATITDAAGRIVAEEKSLRSVDTLGNFVLVGNSGLFATGRYRLAVSEVPASSPPEVHAFTFDVSRPLH